MEMDNLLCDIARLRRPYSYSYSMGIGDAWSVQTSYYKYNKKTKEKLTGWRGGTAYNYGLFYQDKPHYPVPAKLMDSESDLGIRWSNWYDPVGHIAYGNVTFPIY